jgi:hypothetical protein
VTDLDSVSIPSEAVNVYTVVSWGARIPLPDLAGIEPIPGSKVKDVTPSFTAQLIVTASPGSTPEGAA